MCNTCRLVLYWYSCKMIKRSYDIIADVYDRLAGIFIGKALRNAQIYLAQYIPAGAKILIAGGGTGWILEEITRLHDSGLQIDYLDISAGMIAKAKERCCKTKQRSFYTTICRR